jgi:predicted  nucleic acid-binding Zn-ribbon protein
VPREPIDWAKVGHRAVHRRARGMTHPEAAAALEEAELQQHMVRDHEDLASDERGPAEAAEWACIVQLLADVGGVYAPDADAVVQDELAADAERERERQMEDERRRQEEEAEAARRAALAPDALLRTLARTGLLEGLSEDERAAVNRLPDSDPAAAPAVNALLVRAHEAGSGLRPGAAS